MNTENKFGDRLAEAMEEQGISQEDLASSIDSSQSAVSRWVRNEGQPYRSTLIKIGTRLSISPHWLLTGEGPREVPTAGQQTALKAYAGDKLTPRTESPELRAARERVEILKLQIQEAELRKKLAELMGKQAPGVTQAGFQPRKDGEANTGQNLTNTK